MAAPADKELIAVLCCHDGLPQVLRPALACSNGEDEPLYVGDSVVKTMFFERNAEGALNIYEEAEVIHR